MRLRTLILIAVAWIAAGSIATILYTDRSAERAKRNLEATAWDTLTDFGERIDATARRLAVVGRVVARGEQVIDAAAFPPIVFPAETPEERQAQAAVLRSHPLIGPLSTELTLLTQDVAVDRILVAARSGIILAAGGTGLESMPLASSVQDAFPGKTEDFPVPAERIFLGQQPETGEAVLGALTPILSEGEPVGAVLVIFGEERLRDLLPESEMITVLANAGDPDLLDSVGGEDTGPLSDSFVAGTLPLPIVSAEALIQAPKDRISDAQQDAAIIGALTCLVGLLAILGGGQAVAAAAQRRAFAKEEAEQKRLMSLALENMSDAMALVDRDLRYVVFNERYRKLGGQPSDFVRPGAPILEHIRHNASVGRFGDADVEAVVARREKELRNQEALVFHLTPSDGTTWEFHQTPATDFGIVMTARDVTERVEQTRALERARAEAEQATEAKSRFLARMSHEIRTPMNGIVGMLDLLDDGDLSADQSQSLDVVRRSAEMLLVIINDILDLSKLEAGKVAIETVAFSVEDLVEDTLQMIAPRAMEKGLVLCLDYENGIHRQHRGDPTRIRQILFNFLTNAVKFTESGEVTLAISRTDGAASGDRLRFAVEDSGIGMTPEQLGRVFADFVQADESTTRQFGGTGLGLAISRMLAELMGGRAWAESMAGEGSTFYLELDLTPCPEAPPAIPPDTLAGLSISIESTSMRLAGAVAARLSRYGAEAATARSSELPPATVSLQIAGAEPELLSALPDAEQGSLGYLSRRSLIGAAARAAGRSDIAFSRDESRPSIRPTRPAPSREAALADGTLVLLVDDNATNRLVIRRQLTRLGYAADVAEDGEEALALWRETAYGLVLTDCHMPRRDGFSLAEEIRKETAEAPTPVPVIAITASVLEEDRERAEAACIDRLLLKPIPTTELQRVLDAYLPIPGTAPHIEANPRQEEAPSARELTEDAGPPSALLDLSVLAELVGNDPAIQEEVLADFLETTEPDMAALTRAVADSDPPQVRQMAHRVKGSLRTVGAMPAAEIAFQLEEAGGRGEADRFAALLDRLTAAWNDLKGEIARQHQGGDA